MGGEQRDILMWRLVVYLRQGNSKEQQGAGAAAAEGHRERDESCRRCEPGCIAEAGLACMYAAAPVLEWESSAGIYVIVLPWGREERGWANA